MPEHLRRHVRCVWHLQINDASDGIETVYPDGCCELIAHCKTPMHIFNAETGWRQQERCVFATQQRAAIRLAAHGEVDTIGVRLQPAASAVLAKISLADLRDRIIDLASLDATFAMRFVAAARHIADSANVAEITDLLECRLLPLKIDRRIEKAVSQLEACDGLGPVTRVMSASGMSERSFQNAFKRRVGLSAKEFARIQRLQATIRMLDDGAHSMADLSVDRGFSDQAHATREVRRVTGTTPARLRDALIQDRHGDSSVRMAAAFIRGRLAWLP